MFAVATLERLARGARPHGPAVAVGAGARRISCGREITKTQRRGSTSDAVIMSFLGDR